MYLTLFQSKGTESGVNCLTSSLWGRRHEELYHLFLQYSLPRKRTFKVSGTKLVFQLRAALGIQNLSKSPIPKIDSVLEEFKCQMTMEVGLHYTTLYIIQFKIFQPLYPFSFKLSKIAPAHRFPLLSFYLPCTQSSLLTERKWKPPTFQDEVALHQDVKVQRKRPKGPRGQHTPRSQVYSRQYQGLGSGLEKSWCFEYVQVQFRLLIPQPLLE